MPCLRAAIAGSLCRRIASAAGTIYSQALLQVIRNWKDERQKGPQMPLASDLRATRRMKSRAAPRLPAPREQGTPPVARRFPGKTVGRQSCECPRTPSCAATAWGRPEPQAPSDSQAGPYRRPTSGKQAVAGLEGSRSGPRDDCRWRAQSRAARDRAVLERAGILRSCLTSLTSMAAPGAAAVSETRSAQADHRRLRSRRRCGDLSMLRQRGSDRIGVAIVGTAHGLFIRVDAHSRLARNAHRSHRPAPDRCQASNRYPPGRMRDILGGG
jgi:hypothetical protein